MQRVARTPYTAVAVDEALDAFRTMTRVEGIIPALESSHAVAYGLKLAKSLGQDKSIIINVSGRGDKDLHTVMMRDGIEMD